MVGRGRVPTNTDNTMLANLCASGASLWAMPAAPVRVARISKRFGAFFALRDVSFEIRPNEVLGLIGPNGSGKTTLFRCLAGLMPAASGDVSIEGRSISPAERKEHLYFVPDGVRPWPDQTVEWVLRFTAGLHGTTRSRVAFTVGGDGRSLDHVGLVARDLALEPLLGERLRGLSKGELRRVLTAIGLLAGRSLLLLDEPFDGLDLRQTREMMRVLRSEAEGRTLFLSIHQLTDAARVCDRFVLLSAGRVVGEGTLDELRDRAGLPDGALEDVFLALT